MTKLEKVIKGLELHLDDESLRGCEKCPYDASEEEKRVIDWDCHWDELKRDALELLKEREPRVLTLDEVRERKPFHLWVEDLETGAQVFPIAYVGGLYVDSAEDWSVDPDHRNTPEYYGKSWRCWTARPTNEQREAVKWE